MAIELVRDEQMSTAVFLEFRFRRPASSIPAATVTAAAGAFFARPLDREAA